MNEVNNIKTQILLRNDTKANWDSVKDTLILGKGEVGIELDTNKFKIGDNVHTWAELKYFESAVHNTYQDNIDTDGTNIGDVAVVKEEIANGKYMHTAYIWDGANWAAMDGNYNAENVYFNEDLTYTANIGALTLGTQNSKTLSAKGKSLEEVLKKILAETKNPTITQPTYTSLTAKATYKNSSTEIGSQITALGWTANSSKGSYEFGSYNPANQTTTTSKTPGITPVFEVKYGETVLGTTEDSASNVVLAEPIVIDTASSKTYATITGTMSWSNDTLQPVNNIGGQENESGEKYTAIAEGSINQSANLTLTGYYQGCFYGCSTTEVTPDNITSAKVRSLGKTNKAYAKENLVLSVPVGTKSIVIACPADKTGSTYVLNTTVNAEMGTLFGADKIAKTLEVGGADATDENIGNYTKNYNVWIYTPAEAYGSTASLTITLG